MSAGEFGRRQPRIVDVAMALTLCTAMWLMGAVYHPETVFRTGGWPPFGPAAYVLTAVICLPLAARRIAPMSILVVVSAAYTGYLALGYLPSLNFYGPMLAFYTVAAMKSPREAAIGAALLGAELFYSGLMAPEVPLVVAIVQGVAVPPVVWGVAEVSRRLSMRNRQLAAATEQLRREQEHRVEHAVAQERLQIARELHDVVAHHISVIAMQAGLARYVFDTDPATARAAVQTVDGISRETLEELRRVLKLLRTCETPVESATTLVETEPAPGVAGLATLIARVRGVGVNAGLDVTGAVEELPSGLQLTVYRVVQEALTNVIKHAGPCDATVEVRRDDRQLTATITNSEGSPAHPATRIERGGSGHGLLGMRERARLYGGTLTARPRPEGGYVVLLTVPWAAPEASRN